ncbi:MAG: pentapeptide repeat-containing protein [Gemmatimonadaceae bacterium]|nr:pentapeptide repeat-containing protein [Gemmatimonadaceae bacterium]
MKLEPEVIIRGEDLSHANFADLDLTGAVFEECVLRDVRLAGTTCESVRFLRCQFVRCHFAKVEFRDAQFLDCDFTDEDGHTGAHFPLTRMEQTRFQRCNLSFAKFERCDMYSVRIEGCNLRGSALVRSDFSRSFSRKVVKSAGWMTDCNFEFANLAGLKAPECDWRDCRFREAVMHQVDLEGADLRGADFTRASLDGARMARADLRGAEIAGINLMTLSSFEDMKISSDQQHVLLLALGIDVHVE